MIEPATVETITLFVDDLAAAPAFYKNVFAGDEVYADEVSWVFRLGSVMINLLDKSAALEVVEPAPVAAPNAGSRAMFTIKVDDVNDVCATLRQGGVELLNGPVDRLWGRRTAAFADPDGNVWEVAQEI